MKGVYVIRTPENVSFELELAGLGSRALAWGIDVLAMGGLIIAVSILVGLVGVVVRDLASALMFLLMFVIQWGYAVLLEGAWGGRTLGKAMLGLRVIDERGGHLRWPQVIIRNLVRAVDLLPALYFVGGVTSIMRGDARRLGDIAAGTVVVRVRRSVRPSTATALTERYNSFARDPAIVLAARRVSAPERDLMLGLALRREQLPLAVRHRLFGRLATHLEARLRVQRPDFFSDEKFVLNLTAVVLGSTVGYGPRRVNKGGGYES